VEVADEYKERSLSIARDEVTEPLTADKVLHRQALEPEPTSLRKNQIKST
jgi:hypothetical protein